MNDDDDYYAEGQQRADEALPFLADIGYGFAIIAAVGVALDWLGFLK